MSNLPSFILFLEITANIEFDILGTIMFKFPMNISFPMVYFSIRLFLIYIYQLLWSCRWGHQKRGCLCYCSRGPWFDSWVYRGISLQWVDADWMFLHTLSTHSVNWRQLGESFQLFPYVVLINFLIVPNPNRVRSLLKLRLSPYEAFNKWPIMLHTIHTCTFTFPIISVTSH